MDMRLLKTVSAVIFLVLSVTIVLSLAGCSGETDEIREKVIEAFDEDELEITEIILCRQVAEDFTPIEPTEIFPTGTEEIYLSVKFDNLPPENTLKAEWFYYGNSEVISVQEFNTEKLLSGYNSFNIKVKEGFPSGNYRVTVFLDDKTLKVIEFEVS